LAELVATATSGPIPAAVRDAVLLAMRPRKGMALRDENDHTDHLERRVVLNQSRVTKQAYMGNSWLMTLDSSGAVTTRTGAASDRAGWLVEQAGLTRATGRRQRRCDFPPSTRSRDPTRRSRPPPTWCLARSDCASTGCAMLFGVNWYPNGCMVACTCEPRAEEDVVSAGYLDVCETAGARRRFNGDAGLTTWRSESSRPNV